MTSFLLEYKHVIHFCIYLIDLETRDRSNYRVKNVRPDNKYGNGCVLNTLFHYGGPIEIPLQGILHHSV